ncbi:LPXTG cell wall anchor domain-containing protein [Listeria aquatica]|uniref:LPXTG cell wall anchor domain-containing protein n=1 Tax=Listeria aquatica TaxID=1494960 RepID=UPI003F6F5152
MRFLFVTLFLSIGVIFFSPMQTIAQDVNSYNSNGQISFYGNSSTSPDTPPNVPPGESNGSGTDSGGGNSAADGFLSGGALPHTGDSGNLIEILSGIGLLSLSLILMRRREQEGL